MGSILVAMPRIEDSNRIVASIRESGLLLDIEVCSNGADILRTVADRDYGVVICTRRMGDMGYAELAEYLPQYFGMIVLTSDMSIETVSRDMVKLQLPFKRRELISTIEMITGDYFYKIKKKKKIAPKRSKEEQKIIDQAKALLMEVNGMSEPESFRYIQKNSMDFGRTMVESAQMILLLNKSE